MEWAEAENSATGAQDELSLMECEESESNETRNLNL